MAHGHHDHSGPPEAGTMHDDPLAGPTYIVGAVGTVIFLVVVLLVQTLTYETRESMEAEAVEGRDYREIELIRDQHRQELEQQVEWSYPEENRVRIPIGRGVEDVLERYGKGGQ